MRFFRGFKLWFTNRPYYRQWRRYMKRQGAVRKKLKKQANEFCPWSGWWHEYVFENSDPAELDSQTPRVYGV